MPITTLDPKSALIVVDLQKGISAYPLAAGSLESVVEKTNALAEAFRRRGLPVVLVVVTGAAQGRTDEPRRLPRSFPPEFAELLPSLSQAPSDHRVEKQTPGAFTHTDLEAFLRAQGVTQVVITGVATSSGVESTARQAYELGFNVTLPFDAMSDVSQSNHDDSIARIFPRLAETGRTEDVLRLLAEPST